MEALFDPTILIGLATLIVLEVVLGIDNLVFIAILADKLPEHQRDKARLLGLALALVMRLVLLASIAWIVSLTRPVLRWGELELSWRDLILLGGGVFLLIKATREIHERLEGVQHELGGKRVHAGFFAVIVQIVAIDAVFSLDSIITAIGMVEELWVMMTAVVIAMTLMIIASKPLTLFVSRHPTVIILCLSFLLLIGASLVAEGLGFHMPKGYLYAAIGFSLLIELFNQVSGRNQAKALAAIPLRQRTADAILRLVTPAAARESSAPELSETILSPAEAQDAANAFAPAEREMIAGVITLADRPVRSLMTPRHEIFWLDAGASPEENRDRLLNSGRTRVLLCKGSVDEVAGYVEAREALPLLFADPPAKLTNVLKAPLVIPDELKALQLVDRIRRSGERFAIVVDDLGAVVGVVTSTDVFAAIAGDLADDEDQVPVANQDGSIDFDATDTLDDVARSFGDANLSDGRRFSMLSAIFLEDCGQVPGVGDKVEIGEFELEVAASTPSRIERVRARRKPSRALESTPSATTG